MPPSVDDTYGALLIGVITAGILYGFTCVQSWYYYNQYPKDPWHLKLLVGTALLLDTSHQAVITSTIYTYLITNYGSNDPEFLDWGIVGEVFFNATTTLLVQCFLLTRIWKLSNGNWLMTGSALLLALAGFVVAFVFFAMTIRFTTFTQLFTKMSIAKSINALAAAADALIAVYLCYLLQKSRTGFHRSETMINTLMVFTINTGLLTGLCALASLICYHVWPKTYIYIAFYFNIGRLYCNSLLATLNARRSLGGKAQNDDMMFGSYEGHSNQAKFATSRKSMPNNISIRIDTTREFVQDERLSASGDMIHMKDIGVVV